MADKEKPIEDNDVLKDNDICNDQIEGSEKPATDIYSSIKCRIKDTKVDIPTEDAVEKSKEWVENENIK